MLFIADTSRHVFLHNAFLHETSNQNFLSNLQKGLSVPSKARGREDRSAGLPCLQGGSAWACLVGEGPETRASPGTLEAPKSAGGAVLHDCFRYLLILDT